jgi:hypothetical protein
MNSEEFEPLKIYVQAYDCREKTVDRISYREKNESQICKDYKEIND